MLALLSFIALLAAPMAGQQATLASALAELSHGRVLQSIAQFKAILRSDPANAAAYFYLSTLYTEMGEVETAERDLRRAMELNPNQGAHYHQLGVIRYRQKQWPAALDLYRKALELGVGKDEAVVWRSIGDVQLELFDRDAALDAYNASLRIDPQDARTRLALGRFYLDRSEPAVAVEQLRTAVQVNPSLGAAYPALGRAYRQTGDLQAAVQILDKALQLDPADQESRYALGQVLLAAGRMDEGRKQMETYDGIRRQIAGADADYRAGRAALESGNASEAEKLLRESVRLAPQYGPALYSLGALLLDHGSANKAVDFLKRAVQSNPLNADAWFSLSSACLKDGKSNDALDAIQQALVLRDDNPDYQRLFAEIRSKVEK